eukprot:2677367-Pyramimonas_sp.AAC.1
MKGQSIKASWAPILYRPRHADDQLQVCSGWRWLHRAFAEFVQTTASAAEGQAQTLTPQVSLQHSCPGEGLNIRLDASL